jgi:hypothetical protein
LEFRDLAENLRKAFPNFKPVEKMLGSLEFRDMKTTVLW